MTTATTLGDAVFSLNMTRGEDALYKSKVDLGEGGQGQFWGQLPGPITCQPYMAALSWASVPSPVRQSILMKTLQEVVVRV
jgi:hypothetical protein